MEGEIGLGLTRTDILLMIARLAFASATTYLTIKIVAAAIDPTAQQKGKAKQKVQEIFKEMGITQKLNLTEHELMIASQLIVPGQLNTTWEDVAGLSSVIQEIRETIIMPIKQRNKKSISRLIQPPKGILLHGPPGCGKTLLARAVAYEAGARFINLDVASLTDKWYGESQKLSSAVFSVASKIQPCIVFIDEIDSFLRVRNTGDHEATAMMKAQFLQQWDGLTTEHSNCVLVMGATNRPQDVDRAILRRMPSNFYIPLPTVTQREEILKVILRTEDVAPATDISSLAMQTESFTGSDLKELCRTASVYRLKNLPIPQSDGSDDDEELRPITNDDFTHALGRMRESRVLDMAANALHKMDLD